MSLEPRRQTQLTTLLRRFGLAETAPINWSLLDLALTHPSQSPDKNYQQLEFVGDAVVRLTAAEVLMAQYPEAPVGELSALRAILVSDRTLATWGDLYGLDRFVWASAAVLANKKGRISLLADSFEAVLGALFLSTGDLSLIHPWLDEHLRTKAAEIHQDPARYNYKDAVQEWTQGEYKCLPTYRVTEAAAEEMAQGRFQATLWLKEECLGTGQGSSKKSAEQAAAKQAYERFIAPHRPPQKAT